MIMGGYIGSAILGNILFYIGARVAWLVKPAIFFLSVCMIATGFFWYNSIFTSGMLFLFAIALLFIALKTSFGDEVLMFFGLACVLFIIQDFNVGPSSDLEAYAKELVFIPANVWKYIWLAIVVILFFFNLKLMLRSKSVNV